MTTSIGPSAMDLATIEAEIAKMEEMLQSEQLPEDPKYLKGLEDRLDDLKRMQKDAKAAAKEAADEQKARAAEKAAAAEEEQPA